MLKKGLKTNISNDEFYNRMSHKPDVLELYLKEGDLFGDNLILLKSRITEAQMKGIKVYLHQPMHIHSNWLHMLLKDCLEADYLSLSTRILMGICKEFDVKLVVHFSYGYYNDKQKVEPFHSEEKDYDLFIETVNNFLDYFDKERNYILIENSIDGASSFRYDLLLLKKLKGSNIPFCVDVSHLAISLNYFDKEHVYTEKDFVKMNDFIYLIISELQNEINYFHIVDSNALYGIHDSLTLGEGKIDWEAIKRFIIEKDYIYEVGLKNFNDCKEMMISHNFFNSKTTDL